MRWWHELFTRWHRCSCLTARKVVGLIPQSACFPCVCVRSLQTLQLPLAAQKHNHLTGNAKQSAICLPAYAAWWWTVKRCEMRSETGSGHVCEPNCTMSGDGGWMGSYWAKFLHSVGWKSYCSSHCHHISHIHVMLSYLFTEYSRCHGFSRYDLD